MNRRASRNRLVLWCIAIVLVFLLFIIIFEIIRTMSNNRLDTSEGLAFIHAAEEADINTIESRIQQNDQAVAFNGNGNGQSSSGIEETEDLRSNREAFANSVVMGDSITEGLVAYDLLNASSVVSSIGANLSSALAEVPRVVALQPQSLFLAFGVNDVIATNGNVELFLQNYGALIDVLRSELPNTTIFVNSIFPARADAIAAQSLLGSIPEFNEALQQFCEARQIAYIDNSSIIDYSLFEQDGIHFQVPQYLNWLAQMREVAAL